MFFFVIKLEQSCMCIVQIIIIVILLICIKQVKPILWSYNDTNNIVVTDHTIYI